MMAPFSVARLPRIEFGAGCFKKIPTLLTQFGKRVLIVTGDASLRVTPQWAWLVTELQQQGFFWQEFKVAGEPSPQMVDQAVRDFRE